MSLVENEQIKLSATALNGVTVTSIAAGFITPIVAFIFDAPGAASRGGVAAAAVGFYWLGVGLVLHIGARRLLRGLKE
jgi:hypothetical protein